MNKKLLLIDDDDDELVILNAALKMASINYDCIYADSADKALGSFDLINPHIILLDVNMPRMNGLECLKHIREMARYVNTREVVYSTCLDSATQIRAKSLGACACVKKPFTVADLSTILSSLFLTINKTPFSA